MVAVASEAVPWRLNASEANKNLGGFDLYLPGVGSLIPAHTQIWASVWFARFLMNRKSFATLAFSRLAKLVWQLARIALGSGHLAAFDSPRF